MANEISNTDDIIDVRDVIQEMEELREIDERDAEESKRLQTLENLLSDLCGCGGDEQWEGDWYPVTLVRDSYFRDYAEELAIDCGMVDQDASWPNNCIDWDQAARELQTDYSSVDFEGVTYWYR